MASVRLRRLALLAVPLAAAAFTTGPLTGVAAAGTVTVNGTSINDHGTQDVSSASTVSMQMGDMFFAPSILTGRPGQKITIDLTNTGQATHTFTLAAQNVDQTVAPGGKASVTVTFPMSGSTVWMCRFHTSMGMNGALQVAAAVASPTPTPVPTPARSSAPTAAGSPTMTSGGGTTNTTSGTTSTKTSSTASGTTSGGASTMTSGTSKSAVSGATASPAAASQAAPVPAGGAATGAGGTAGRPNVALLLAGALLTLSGAVLLALRRRTTRTGD